MRHFSTYCFPYRIYGFNHVYGNLFELLLFHTLLIKLTVHHASGTIPSPLSTSSSIDIGHANGGSGGGRRGGLRDVVGDVSPAGESEEAGLVEAGNRVKKVGEDLGAGVVL